MSPNKIYVLDAKIRYFPENQKNRFFEAFSKNQIISKIFFQRYSVPIGMHECLQQHVTDMLVCFTHKIALFHKNM